MKPVRYTMRDQTSRIPRNLQKRTIFLFLNQLMCPEDSSRFVLWVPIHFLLELSLLMRLCIPVHQVIGLAHTGGRRIEAPRSTIFCSYSVACIFSNNITPGSKCQDSRDVPVEILLGNGRDCPWDVVLGAVHSSVVIACIASGNNCFLKLPLYQQ